MKRIARLAGALAAASLGLAAPSFAQMYGPPGGMPPGVSTANLQAFLEAARG